MPTRRGTSRGRPPRRPPRRPATRRQPGSPTRGGRCREVRRRVPCVEYAAAGGGLQALFVQVREGFLPSAALTGRSSAVGCRRPPRRPADRREVGTGRNARAGPLRDGRAPTGRPGPRAGPGRASPSS
ncbi:hypothetical protein [Ornithinimicrobium kibberense]|uniref:hypothetical protein n=1 Tax=Ornithinimicrobium kibberense TaxID=282060 RepID=UPI00361CE43C